VLVEHARNVLAISDASHAESGPVGDHVITPLACSLDGMSIDITLRPHTTLARLYGAATSATERTTCTYGLDPARQSIATTGGMTVSAVDATGEVRAVERPGQRFFLATLYQPQLRSSPAHPHPVWLGLVDACR
jgi:CTP synthase (UTP-ammonia lyase)